MLINSEDMVDLGNSVFVRVLYILGLQFIEIIGHVQIFCCESLFIPAVARVQLYHDAIVDVVDLRTVVHQVASTGNEVEFAEGLLEVRVLQFKPGLLVQRFFADSERGGEGG
jgi:hypothetical protein